MADENDNGPEPQIQPEVTTEAPASAAEPQQASAGSENPSPEAERTTAGASAPGRDKERDDAFAVYENALGNVDWGYKLKSGDERDTGHKSMMIAERAFIAASVFDDKKAGKLYEQYAGRPAKEELVKRADAHREALKTPGAAQISIPDLTAGIAMVGQRRDLAKLHANKDEIEKKLGNWDSALGDSEARSKSHLKAGNDQMLKQEKPRDDGLHIFKALHSGMRAAGEYGEMFHHRGRAIESMKTVLQQTKEHKTVQDQIANFGKTPGVEMKDTTGPNGQNVARFQKAFGVVKAAMGKPERTPAAAAIIENGPQKSSAARMAAQAAQRAGVGR